MPFTPIHTMSLSEQEIVRREALTELRSLGIDPFPPEQFEVNAYSADIKADFDAEVGDYQDVK